MRPFVLLTLALAACGPMTDAEPLRLELPTIRSDFADEVAPVPRLTPARCRAGAAAMVRGRAFTDLQAALDASAPGDAVIVCSGVHTGPFIIRNQGPLVLRGQTGAPADVVLQASGDQPVLAMGVYHASLRLQGLTLTGVTGDDGVFEGASEEHLQIVDCDIRDNSGLYVWIGTMGDLLIERSSIHDNTTTWATFELRIDGQQSHAIVRDTTIARNTSDWLSGISMSIDPDYDPPVTNHVVFDRVEIVDNENTVFPFRDYEDPTVPWREGEIMAITGYEATQVGFRDVHARGNDSGAQTVGVSARGPDDEPITFLCERCSFTDNTMWSTATLYFYQNSGPAIHHATIRDSEILRNEVFESLTTTDVPAAFDFDFSWIVDVQNVDLGLGADTNLPRDTQCRLTDYGPGSSGTVSRGDGCL